MKGFVGDIEMPTEKNSDFRRVLYTAKHLQLVLMALPPTLRWQDHGVAGPQGES